VLSPQALLLMKWHIIQSASDVMRSLLFYDVTPLRTDRHRKQ